MAVRIQQPCAYLCEHSKQQRADLQYEQTGISQKDCYVHLTTSLTFSLSICGSGGGTTIVLAGCKGSDGAAGATGTGAGGSVSLSRASLGETSLVGASRGSSSLKLGSLPL